MEEANTSNEAKETKIEVSLPGSDVNSTEQPAILHVLSPLNAKEEQIDKQKENPANRVILVQQPSSEEPTSQVHNDVDVNDNENTSDKNLDINLVRSSNKSQQSQSHLVITTPTPTPTPSPSKDCKIDPHTGEILFPETPIKISQDNILDIESHLIETYNELFPNEESVGINELPPIEDELQVGCSKVETKDNVRTVIEVQPAEIVTKKPIEKLIEADEPLQAAQTEVPTELSNGESCINEEQIAKVAEKLIQDIEEEIVTNWDKIATQQNLLETSEESEDKTDDSLATVTKKTESLDESAKSEDQLKEYTTLAQEIDIDENLKANEKIIENKTSEPSSELPGKADSITNSNSDEINEASAQDKLTEVVDQQLFEVKSILDSQNKAEESSESKKDQLALPVDKCSGIKVVTVPLSKTASEEEERKLFIESLPHLETHETLPSEAEKLALDCKREYYQSLKKYLVQSSTDKPPVPLQTYRWEDLRRAKERGGYPWTHLYKRPLGPDDQPEIVLMLRKSQEIRFVSESPKSNKKVRIDDHVSIQETERYIQELSEEEEDEPHSEHLPNHRAEDLENHSLHSESFSFASDSVLATGKQPKKAGRFSKVRRLFRRRRYGARQHDDAQSLPDSFTNTSLQHSLEQVPQGSENKLEQKKLEDLKGENKKEEEPIYVHSKAPRCFPIMKKLKSMADRQKKRLNIKRIHLGKDEKIVLNEEPKILKLKNSPKSQRSDIPHFIEKQDSDDVLEIVQLDESPSRKRRDDDRYESEEKKPESSIVKPEEIIEISDIQAAQTETKQEEEEVTEEVTYKKAEEVDAAAIPPKKAPRLRREHVYEEIDQPDEVVAAAEELKFILDATSVDAIKQSLASQDTSAVKEVATTNNNIPLDRMGSSEEEPITSLTERATPERKSNTLLAPISSIDSASSDEDRAKQHLQPVTEEETDQEHDEVSDAQQINLTVSQDQETLNDRKPSLKKEASPAPSEKKVTFSHVEDEAEPHREDIELTAEQLEATKEATKWKNTLK